jgi:hypothetical protein
MIRVFLILLIYFLFIVPIAILDLDRGDHFPKSETMKLVDTSSVTYPIHRIIFNTNTIDTAATGSDNWPVTWADDDHQYSAFGDGGGFGGNNNAGRVSMGISRISGNYMSHTFRNINGGLNPESGNTQWPDVPGQGGKSYGIISIDGVMWLWRTGTASGNTAHLLQDLWKSTNHGATWIKTGVSWTKSGDFGNSYPLLYAFSFVQYDQDHQTGRGDDNVYTICSEATNDSWGVEKPGNIYLMKVHKDSMEIKAAYRFFTGMAGNEPVWGALPDREPIFTHPDGVWTASVIFNYTFKRYILTTVQESHKQQEGATLGIYDSNLLWGTWKTVFYGSPYTTGIDFGNFIVHYNFSQKWMNDTSGVMVYNSHQDNWSTIMVAFDSNRTSVSVGEWHPDNFNNFQLYQNYPNPFNPTTSIQYAVSSKGFITLKVYDFLGREVATLVNEEKQPGVYEVEFSAGSFGDAGNLSSGTYFYKLSAGSFVQTKKMILIK